MAILMVVMMSVFMLIGVSATSLRNSEMLDMAKNIGVYTIEYLRARNVTLDNNFINTTNNWYSASNTSAPYPGLVDLGSNPLETSNSVALSGNTNPAVPLNKYVDKPAAFYSSLQGYVSLANNPSNADPSLEDGNAKVVGGKYYDRTIAAAPPYVVRFPASSSSSAAIKNFAALSGYNGKIYSSNANRTISSKPEYDPHYTTAKTGTMAYRGFRELTQVVARAQTAGTHVQYYDIRVTVFWILGSAEHSYSISTQIATYGGS